MPQQSSVSTVQHLTASDLAHRLNLKPDYLRRSILGQAGGIPAIKLGDGEKAQWRIRLCDVEAWEASRTVCYDVAPKRQRTR